MSPTDAPIRALLLNAVEGLRGGSQRSIRTIANAMRSAGHPVSVATPAGPWAELMRADGIPPHPLQTSGWLGGMVHQASLTNLVRLVQLCRRERIQVLHTFQYGSSLLARAAADVLSIGHLHTVLGPLSPGQRFGDDHMTAHCGRMRRDAIAVGAQPQRVDVIPHRFAFADSEPLDPPAEPQITLIARLDGPLSVAAEQFVEAARLVVLPAKFVVVGAGGDLDRLRRAAGPVTFQGWREDLDAVYRETTLLVGSARCVVEGLAAGVPSLVLAPNGFRGVVEPGTWDGLHDTNFYMDGETPTGPATLAAAIDELLDSPVRQHELRSWSPDWTRGRLDMRHGVPLWESAWRRAMVRPARLGSTAGLVLGLAATRGWRTLKRRLSER